MIHESGGGRIRGWFLTKKSQPKELARRVGCYLQLLCKLVAMTTEVMIIIFSLSLQIFPTVDDVRSSLEGYPGMA